MSRNTLEMRSLKALKRAAQDACTLIALITDLDHREWWEANWDGEEKFMGELYLIEDKGVRHSEDNLTHYAFHFRNLSSRIQCDFSPELLKVLADYVASITEQVFRHSEGALDSFDRAAASSALELLTALRNPQRVLEELADASLGGGVTTEALVSACDLLQELLTEYRQEQSFYYGGMRYETRPESSPTVVHREALLDALSVRLEDLSERLRERDTRSVRALGGIGKQLLAEVYQRFDKETDTTRQHSVRSNLHTLSSLARGTESSSALAC